MNPATVQKASADAADSRVWAALSDPTRRRILDILRLGSRITREICDEFVVSRFAIMKHLKVLVAAGLVIVERQGKQRVNHLNPLPLQAMYRRWIRPFEEVPADRLLKLKQVAEQGVNNDDD